MSNQNASEFETPNRQSFLPVSVPDQSTSFAQKLAGYFIAERGFQPEFPPEVEPLRTAADILLSRRHGQMLEIVAIVDGEIFPGKTFTLSVEETRAVADACLEFKISRNGPITQTSRVAIWVVETTLDPEIDDPFDAKSGFVRLGFLDKRALNRIVINPQTRNYRTSLKPDEWFIAKVLNGPLLNLHAIATRRCDYTRELRPPVLTYSLLALLAAVFGLEIALNIGPSTALLTPTIATLTTLGGTLRALMLQQGEWYRLWTAMFLHVGLTHLLLNGLALFLAGRILEPMLGRLRFLAIFLTGGICGSLASVFWNPPNLVGVGASGAIMACFATLFVLAFHFRQGEIQTVMMRRSISILVPSMLPFLNFKSGEVIDYAAHAGGAISGALIGAGLLVTWQQNRALPAGRWVSITMIVVGVGGMLYGAAMLGLQFREQLAIARAIPTIAKDAEVQDLWRKGLRGDPAFLEQFPSDPRSHIALGVFLLDHGKYAEAEAEARKALNQKLILEKLLPNVVSAQATSILALTENLQGRANEAIEAAKPACGVKTGFETFLIKQDLCPAHRPVP